MFLNSLKTKWPLPGEDEWTLLEDLEYDPGPAAEKLVVPAGQQTDLASIPRSVDWLFTLVFWRWWRKTSRPAVLHDYLYRLAGVSRQLADAYFRQCLMDDEVPRWVTWIMWFFVRIGGGGSFEKLDGKVARVL